MRKLLILLLLSALCLAETINLFDGSSTADFTFTTPGTQYTYFTITEADQCVDLDASNSMVVEGNVFETTEFGQSDIVVITDRSGSMNRNFPYTAYGVHRDCDDPDLLELSSSRISVAKCIQKEFVNDVVNASNPDLRIGLVTYAASASTLQTLTNDNDTLINRIDTISATGSTCISCAIRVAVQDLLDDGNPASPWSIILMTDGAANTCYVSCPSGGAVQQARDFAYDASDPLSAISNGITIYTVVFGQETEVNVDLLQDIATNTGGEYYASDNPEGLFDIYEDIAAAIHTNSYPSPRLDIEDDGSRDFNTTSLSSSITWDDNCPGADCRSLIEVINESTTSCSSPPCTIPIAVSSSTPGELTLRDLMIETGPCYTATYCGDGIAQWPNDDGVYEECDDANSHEMDGCDNNCQNETICFEDGELTMVDRTVEFNYSSFPAYDYDLENMIYNVLNLDCYPGTLSYTMESSVNFSITGPGTGSDISVVPANPDWTAATSETLTVNAECQGPGCYQILSNTTERYGDADVVLITDYSGSMKKAISTWDSMGYMSNDCDAIYNAPDARKTNLADCVDIEFVYTVLNYSGNRVWPVYIHNDEIKSYTGDPSDPIDIENYIDAAGPQGDDKTCLACAVNEAYEILAAHSSPDRHQFVILMTDGIPTHCADSSCESTSTDFGQLICEGYCDTNGAVGCGIDEGCNDNACSDAEDNTLFAVDELIQSHDAIFYTVAFGLVEDCSTADSLLGEIADISGGTYYQSSDTQTIRNIYEEIADNILTISEEKVWVPGPDATYRGNAELELIYSNESICGDGLVFDIFGEECDDAGANSDTDPNACRTNCTLPVCGDGIHDDLYGEECDDGNNDNFDSCNNTCSWNTCNDGVTNAGEECDDGPFDVDLNDECIIDQPNGYLCMNATCGDGYVWDVDCTGTECEDCDEGMTTNVSSTCRTDCTWPQCGDLITDYDAPWNESCDDGRDGDDSNFCLDDCTWRECGNGIPEGIEECDDGDDGNNHDECIFDGGYSCRNATCGDGYHWNIDCGSLCEDCDGTADCDSSCNRIIGTGVCGDCNDDGGSEQCDDCNANNNDACINDGAYECMDAVCRDGFLWIGVEDCDDGNNIDNDMCTNLCNFNTPVLNMSTLENITFSSVDLYDIDMVEDYFGTPETLLTLLESSGSHMNVTLGENAFKVAPYDGFTGWEWVNITMSDGLNTGTIAFNMSVEAVTQYIRTQPDPTRLLVAKGKTVTGYFKDPLMGDISMWGPYTITVKVWEK